MYLNKSSSTIAITLVVAALIVLGLIAWRIFEANRSNSTSTEQQSNNHSNKSPQDQSSNLITEYFEPANVQFAHDTKWTYNNTGLTAGFAGHPNKKQVQLIRPYHEANEGAASQYSITFSIDSIQPDLETTLSRFEKLGEVKLGDQTLHILHAHYDPEQIGMRQDKIITSSCADKQCAFKLNGVNMYFDVAAAKGVQAPAPLDISMLPELTAIIQSLRVGKP